MAAISIEFRSKGARQLYHFTDAQNVPSIRTYGLLSLAEMRRRGLTPPAPGGNPLSHQLDTARGLDHYVHLCFRDNHPMCFNAWQDGRIPNPVRLRIDLSILEVDGLSFTLDVANQNGVEQVPAPDVIEQLDWRALYGPKDFNDSDFKKRLSRAERAEILIPTEVPVGYITFP